MSKSSETLLEAPNSANLFGKLKLSIISANYSNSFLAFEGESTTKSIIKPDNEVKLIKANTKWQRCIKEKQQQMKAIKNLYDHQKRVNDEIKQVQRKKIPHMRMIRR